VRHAHDPIDLVEFDLEALWVRQRIGRPRNRLEQQSLGVTGDPAGALEWDLRGNLIRGAHLNPSLWLLLWGIQGIYEGRVALTFIWESQHMAEKTSITKKEAVRQALAKLGNHAMPLQIRDFVKQQFSIDMTNDHISVCKGEILKKAGKGKAKVGAGKQASAKPQGDGVSKMEGMRRALAELGRDANPAQIQAYLQQKFGIAMTTRYISKYKGKIPKKPATRKPAARKNKVKAGGNSKSSGIPLEDVLTVKDLVVRLGADQVRTLLDTFGR
jgi:hypothetical protein